MYQVYEHGKDEHGGCHVYPCGEGVCSTFEEAANLAQAWNEGEAEEGWEWLCFYPIWVHTQAEKDAAKLVTLTAALKTSQEKVKALEEERDAYRTNYEDTIRQLKRLWTGNDEVGLAYIATEVVNQAVAERAKVARLVEGLEIIARNGALITSRQENDGVRMLTLKALKTLADSEEK